jgi:hypothetical protein
MFYINNACLICHYGQIGFRLCSDHKNVVLMCDECDTVWLDPKKVDTEHALYPSPPEFIIPILRCSIKSPEARWATRQEIARQGWEGYIAGEGQALDEE